MKSLKDKRPCNNGMQSDFAARIKQRGFGSFIVRSAYHNSLVAVRVLPTTNLGESDIKVSRSVHLIVKSESSLYNARFAQQFWPISNNVYTEKTWPLLNIINPCFRRHIKFVVCTNSQLL